MSSLIIKKDINCFILKNIILIVDIFIIFFSKIKIFQFQSPKFFIKNELKEDFIYSFSESLKNNTNSINLFFKYKFINYDFSLKFNIIEVEFDIFFMITIIQ